MKQTTNRHELRKIWDRMFPQEVVKDYQDEEHNHQVSLNVLSLSFVKYHQCEKALMLTKFYHTWNTDALRVGRGIMNMKNMKKTPRNFSVMISFQFSLLYIKWWYYDTICELQLVHTLKMCFPLCCVTCEMYWTLEMLKMFLLIFYLVSLMSYPSLHVVIWRSSKWERLFRDIYQQTNFSDYRWLLFSTDGMNSNDKYHTRELQCFLFSFLPSLPPARRSFMFKFSFARFHTAVKVVVMMMKNVESLKKIHPHSHQRASRNLLFDVWKY